MKMVDGGVTEQFFDNKLTRSLKDRMTEHTLLDALKTVVIANNRELRGTATGILYGTNIHQAGNEHGVRFPAEVVLGPESRIFYATVAMQRGITTILEEASSHLWEGDVVVPLHQQEEGLAVTIFAHHRTFSASKG